MLKLKRVYDPVSRSDGTRFLVERLWPRGLSKERMHGTTWLKDVGPSTELRQWFNHDPLKWSRFRERYFRELDSRPQSWEPVLTAARQGIVTLVYSSLRFARGLGDLAESPLEVNVFDPDDLLGFGSLSVRHSVTG